MTLKKESLTKGQLFITRVQPYSFKYVRKQQQQIGRSTCGLKNITKKVERTYPSCYQCIYHLGGGGYMEAWINFSILQLVS